MSLDGNTTYSTFIPLITIRAGSGDNALIHVRRFRCNDDMALCRIANRKASLHIADRYIETILTGRWMRDFAIIPADSGFVFRVGLNGYR